MDTRVANEEKELERKIQIKIDDVVKKIMEWEKRILHFVAITYLIPKAAIADYHMPTLPYPQLKHEVLL